MEKRSSVIVPDVVVEEVDTVSTDGLDITPQTLYNEPEQIRVVSLFSAHLKYVGQVTGKLYIWQNSGDIVGVHADDVPFLLEKRIGEGACCGAVARGNKIFELA